MSSNRDRSGSFSVARHRLQEFDYASPDHAFFVTACAHGHSAPFVDDRLARLVVDSLTWLRVNRGISLYAFCLMPDHLHLLLQLGSDRWPLGQIMASMKQFTTREAWELGWTGVLWQARFHDRVVRGGDECTHIATYILENPARKGLVERAEAYLWSGTPDALR